MQSGSLDCQLKQLSAVEITLVADHVIAAAHEEFMGIAGPTDVITFQHGEIVVSVDTARRQAAEFGNDLERELALYIAHGLLHLHGHDDRLAREAAVMKDLQEQLLSLHWDSES